MKKRKLVLSGMIAVAIFSAIFVACQKKETNNVTPAETQLAASAPVAKEFVSGTSNGSTDGHKMTVSIDKNGVATVTTEYLGNIGTTQNVFFDFGDLDVDKVFLNNKCRVINSEGKEQDGCKIIFPEDGNTYWLIYFDSKMEPINSHNVVGNLIYWCWCAGGQGCYVAAHGCGTSVCRETCTVQSGPNPNSVGSNKTSEDILINKGFIIVKANKVIVNGKSYM